MSAGRYDLKLRAGTDLTISPVYKNPAGSPINLTGFTARASFRRGPKSASLLNLSTGSGITLGGVLGTVSITITAAQATTLLGRGVFAVELVSGGGLVEEFIEGNFVSTEDTVTT
jgi:hypothetical protein